MINLKQMLEAEYQEESTPVLDPFSMDSRVHDPSTGTSDNIAPSLQTHEETSVRNKKLTVEEKKKLLELVGQFRNYRSAMKMADELTRVAENIVYISELTEKYGLNETSEWFKGVSLERDMKELRKYATELHKIANKVHPQIQEAESIYEEIGLKLSRYYEI